MDSIFGKRRASGEGEGAHWLSVSDLMAGLMMVFLFISIALMRDALIERDQIKEIAVAYQENQVAIYRALQEEFESDLEKWDAAIDREDLAFRFRSPEVLFEQGRAAVRPRFKAILDDFFPRYLEVLRGFRDSIREVRIEGHTSSVWNQAVSDTQAYFLNMELSQDRTRSVLRYVYRIPGIGTDQQWVKKNIAAVGLSSSQRILTEDGQEDRAKSRRVTFRVVTNAETQIRRILEEPES